jgi:hypothetical protein
LYWKIVQAGVHEQLWQKRLGEGMLNFRNDKSFLPARSQRSPRNPFFELGDSAAKSFLIPWEVNYSAVWFAEVF